MTWLSFQVSACGHMGYNVCRNNFRPAAIPQDLWRDRPDVWSSRFVEYPRYPWLPRDLRISQEFVREFVRDDFDLTTEFRFRYFTSNASRHPIRQFRQTLSLSMQTDGYKFYMSVFFLDLMIFRLKDIFKNIKLWQASITTV